MVVSSGMAGVEAAAWAPDSAHFAVADSNHIWVFETQTLQQVNVFSAPKSTESKNGFRYRHGLGNSLVFVSNQQLATGGMGGMISTWNIAGDPAPEIFNWPVAYGFTVSLAFDPDSGLLAAGTGEGNVVMVKPGTQEEPEKLAGVSGIVLAMQFSSNPGYLGAAGTGSDLVVWDLNTKQEAGRIPVQGPVYDIDSLGASGEYLVAGQDLTVIKFADLQSADTIASEDMTGQAVAAGAIVAAGTGAVVALSFIPFVGPALAQTAVSTGILVAPGPGAADSFCKRSVAVASGGGMLADMNPGIVKEKIRILDTKTRAVLQELDPRGGDSCGMSFSPDGKYLLIANHRGAHLYDTETWTDTRMHLKMK
jgi:WD40 repeat protein